MAQVVDANIVKFGQGANCAPRFLQVDQMLAVATDDHVRVVDKARESFEKGEDRTVDGDGFLSGLAVRQEDNRTVEVHIRPFEGQDFCVTRASKDEEAESRNREWRDEVLALSLGQCSPQTTQLVRLEEAFPALLFDVLHAAARVRVFGTVPGLAAVITVSKYADGLPLHRLEGILARYKISVAQGDGV